MEIFRELSLVKFMWVGGVGNDDNVINGEYTSTRQHSCIKLGVIDRWYVMHHRDGRHFIVQSMDGLGSTWTISSFKAYITYITTITF